MMIAGAAAERRRFAHVAGVSVVYWRTRFWRSLCRNPVQLVENVMIFTLCHNVSLFTRLILGSLVS